MNIKPKSVSLTEVKTFTLKKLVVVATVDYPTKKVLRVHLDGVATPIIFAGGKYDEAGQWTDESLLQFLAKELGVEEADE